MVFASICEHASNAFIFASTSSDQFSHASSELLRNYKWHRSSEHFVNFQPAGISLYQKVLLRHIIWLTLSKQDNRRKLS